MIICYNRYSQVRLWDQVLQEVHFDQVLHPGQADLEGQGILCLPCLPSYHQGQLHHQGHPSVRRVQVNLAVLVNPRKCHRRVYNLSQLFWTILTYLLKTLTGGPIKPGLPGDPLSPLKPGSPGLPVIEMPKHQT